jgi:uncharacterized protein YjcR
MTRAELEQRRFEAQKLFAKGVRQANVARTLGVTRTTAQRWKLMGLHDWRTEKLLIERETE